MLMLRFAAIVMSVQLLTQTSSIAASHGESELLRNVVNVVTAMTAVKMTEYKVLQIKSRCTQDDGVQSSKVRELAIDLDRMNTRMSALLLRTRSRARAVLGEETELANYRKAADGNDRLLAIFHKNNKVAQAPNLHSCASGLNQSINEVEDLRELTIGMEKQILRQQ